MIVCICALKLDIVLHMYVYFTYARMNTEQFKDMLKPMCSEPGTRKREIQERTYIFSLDLLEECDGEYTYSIIDAHLPYIFLPSLDDDLSLSQVHGEGSCSMEDVFFRS